MYYLKKSSSGGDKYGVFTLGEDITWADNKKEATKFDEYRMQIWLLLLDVLKSLDDPNIKVESDRCPICEQCIN